MNPFLMMLLQQIFQSGFDPNQLGTSMFGQNPSSNLNQGMFNPFGQGMGNPFIFSPFPMGGNPIPGQQGPLPGRPMDNRRRIAGGALQPTNEPPVDIPAPVANTPPYVPPGTIFPQYPFGNRGLTRDPNQPLFDDPGVPQGGVIAPPRDTTPFAPPPPPSPFFIEPLPGIRVPINLTGIFGQGMPTPNAQGGGLPARPNNPNALGMIPRR